MFFVEYPICKVKILGFKVQLFSFNHIQKVRWGLWGCSRESYNSKSIKELPVLDFQVMITLLRFIAML